MKVSALEDQEFLQFVKNLENLKASENQLLKEIVAAVDWQYLNQMCVSFIDLRIHTLGARSPN